MARVLVIDDEELLRESLRQGLQKQGYGVECRGSARGAAEDLAGGRFDLVLLDNIMPGG